MPLCYTAYRTTRAYKHFYSKTSINVEQVCSGGKFRFLQLKTVVWKNWVIRKRHYILTLCEGFLPILLFLAIAYGRGQISGLNKQQVPEPTYFPVNFLTYELNQLHETELLFVPNNEFFSDVIKATQIKFTLDNSKIKGFGNTKDMLEYYTQNHNGTVIAVIFKENDATKLDYSLRYYSRGYYWYTETLYENQFAFDPTRSDTAGYIWRTFIHFQKALDMSYIEVTLQRQKGLAEIPNLDDNFTISYEQFPYPPYVQDDGLKSLCMLFLPLITLFSFIFICPAVLKRVVEEKHSGIKELMKMVGMKSWMLWLGWFIYSLLPMLISIPIIVVFLKVPLFGSPYAPIEHSDGFVLFVFLSLYCMAATVFCFFISTIFSKPTLAMIVGLIVWILSYAVPKYLLEIFENNPLPLSVTMLFNLLPNMALHFGYAAISPFEETGKGVHWHNVNQSGSGGTHEITLAHVIIMLAFDIFFYMLLTVYVDSINPGKYGVRKSIFYPLSSLKKFVLRVFGRRGTKVWESETVPLDNIEKGEGLGKGIEIRNLYKKFGIKQAVSNLSMDVYKEQITVLLGHNGAGKSTTMSMITGMISSTSGTIMINGKDTKKHLDEIRQDFGLCPQHNLLFPDLTVAEHLEFFARLKGISTAQAKRDIDSLLTKLNLRHKAGEMAHTLSGGMKRKLCLGMAVIGGSKVLILDEPTSGMDPESRRELWDLLLSWRGKKTILITTHFMEEADALGDWIAIMADGRLQCYGTPMYLKKNYATGYHLSLVVEPTADEIKIENVLRTHIGAASLKSRDGNMLTFVLPFESCAKFGAMLEELETRRNELEIESEAVTLTTLEDVFLKAKEASTKLDNHSLFQEQEKTSNLKTSRIVQKTKALCSKRCSYMRSKLATYAIPFLICLLLFIISIFLSAGSENLYSSNGSEIKLKLSTYGDTRVYYNFTDNDGFISKLANQYEQVVKMGKGEPVKVANVEQAIIKEGVDNIAFYHRHMVAAAEFLPESGRTELRLLHSGTALHAAPIALNLMTNTLAKALLGESYSISTSNWPLGTIAGDASPNQISETKVMLLWLLIVPIGALFILSSFIFFPHTELSTNFAQLQFMAGVRPYTYWLLNFVTDYVIYFVMMIAILVLTMFLWPPLKTSHEIGGILLIVALYGWSGVPFTYLFSRKQSASGAYALFIILGLFTGVLPTLILGVMIESGDETFARVGKVLRDICLILFPQYGFTYEGVMWAQKVTQNYNFHGMPRIMQLGVCARDNNPCCANPNSHECTSYESPTRLLWDEHKIHLMFVGGIVYFGINVFLHTYLWKKMMAKADYKYYELKRYIMNETSGNRNDIDNDLNDETTDTSTLKVKKLRKSYSGKEVVRNVSFHLNKGLCLGILGVNGAGKSTTFKMLTREEVRDKGMVTADGDDIENDKYLQKLGYCPQTDALNFVLTGRQILTLMANLRGCPKPDQTVQQFLDAFELHQYADVPCGQYSGGNKRKLSLAIAIIGYPDYVLLDEPTNGVDPSARRKFWTLIKRAQNTQRTSFVLTSHSMAECEALCNNLKIMKDGTIHKEGTIATLKQGVNGFSIKMKLKNKRAAGPKEDEEVYDEFDSADQASRNSVRFNDVDDLKRYFTTGENAGEIKDEHSGLLHIYLKNKEKKWSQLFREMEELKADNPDLIEDYSISEASLEDVFLSVAREKTGG